MNAQFSGWPYALKFDDLEGRKPLSYLPDLLFRNIENPVVEIINETTQETEYVTRVLDSTFRPAVFSEGRFTIKVTDASDSEIQKTFSGVQPVKKAGDQRMTVSF